MNSLPPVPPTPKLKRWGRGAALVVVLGMGLGLAFWARHRLATVPTSPVKSDAAPVAVVVSPYVGSQACVECHAERVAEYQTTNHFRTCRVPDPKSMTAILATAGGIFRTRNPDLHFETYREGNQLFQAAVRKTPTAETRTVSRVDLVLGAGNSDEVYLAWHDDGYMFELPVAWIESEKQWGAAAWWRGSQFDKIGPADGTRELTLRCLECHSTSFEHVPGTLNQYRRQNHLMGVSCENCHGPARQHVAFHHAHPGEKSPAAIVRPARLPRERDIETCTQCHSNAIKHRGPALSYRPGKPLEDFYKTVQTRSTEEDHVANQIHYLRQSKCFQNDATLTCTTCHNPHRSTGDASPARIENSCLNCHDRQECGERPRLPVAVQDECIQCHMPSYLKINVNFQTETDDFVPPVRRYEHRIAIHPEARNEVLWHWHRQQPDEASRLEAARLARGLAEHHSAEAEKCRREFRFLGQIAAYREAVRFDDSNTLRDKLRRAIATQNQLDADWSDAQQFQERGAYHEAELTLKKLLGVKPDHALAWGKLGLIHALKKEPELADECLRKVSQCDPDMTYGESMLGWLRYLDGRNQEALEFFRRADEIEPFNSTINLRLGLVLLKLEQFDAARKQFEKTLVIDPNNLEACRNLVSVLRHLKMPRDAVEVARRAAQLTEFKDLQILIDLAETSAEAGLFTEAADIAARALELAESSKSHQATVLRKRLESYRARR